MSSAGGEITHVSDTALMVAACRALENELDDAFVRDPFAARLSGERGLAILRGLPHSGVARLGLVVRARFVDDLLLEALAASPIQTVLSAGCGLDTRPWRLNLPPDLRWIEVDLAGILDYKDRLMTGETARCRRERLTADLNDAAQRRAVYQAAGAAPSLLITEGLLMYLPGATVDALAEESRNQSGILHWITDFTTTAFGKAIGGTDDSMKAIRHVQASDALKGEQLFDAIRRHGWATASWRSYITDAGFALERVRRMTGAAPPPLTVAPGDPSGAHRLERA